ncbi:uncharacterized protein LOC116369940, partial [Oncorhynchus kisutch]|uniref:uncharacterized protein LOC116369940 n=1 Tax=Oncorhynchus kisutch TaxID=8019 RepID=UPI0012DC24A1
MEDVNSSTEVTTEVEPTTGVELTEPPRPTVERRLPGHRPYVKWPGASDKKLWETVNTDLTLTLEKLRGTVEKKLERMGDIIYEYGTERFGVEEAKGGRKVPTPPVSRRQQEIKRLVQERRQLKKQWKKASEVEKDGIEENTVRGARTASAPGPNAVPYKVYKNAPDVLRFLWRLMRTAWKNKIIPKVWRRAGGVLIPKEKDAVNISQSLIPSLLNVEGKIFFRVIAQRMAEYLQRNAYVDTSVQKAGISGFSGCLEHSSMIWHQIQMAKVEKRDLHVVFLDLANAFGSVPHE